MRITNPKVLERFMRRHRASVKALREWERRVLRADWRTPHDAQNAFSGVINLGRSRLLFKVMHNRYRLVADVDYKTGTVYIRFIGDHADYDDIRAREV